MTSGVFNPNDPREILVVASQNTLIAYGIVYCKEGKI